jgi:type II secretory pathway pseudopilin PulG
MKGIDMVNTLSVDSAENGFLKTRKPGYSLVEIMLVLGIIIALLGGVFYLGSLAMTQVRKTTTQQTLQALNFAINRFHSDTLQYPTSLRDLMTKPQSGEFEGWDGPYWTKPMKDSWGKQIMYKLTPDGNNPYDLYTKTPNGNILR